MRHSERGFTITELIIALVVGSIVIGLLFSVTLNYYVKLLKSEVTTEMALESQAALSQLTEDIRLATSIGSTNTLTDPNEPGGGWATSESDNVLIIDAPAIDSNRDIIYDDQTGSAFRNEYIYFVSDTKMYKRVLKNTNAPGNVAVTTCPPAAATDSCPSDRLFGSAASDFSFTMYDENDDETADPTLARALFLNLSMERAVFGEDLSLSNSTRVTFRNQ